MNTQFPIPAPVYTQGFLNQLIQNLRRYFESAVSRDEETPRIILRSPGGKNFDVTVDDAGVLVVTETERTLV